MNEQAEMMNQEIGKTYPDTNPELEGVRKDKTNLQCDTEKTAENFVQSDNLSDRAKSAEQTGTKEDKKAGMRMDADSGAEKESASTDWAEANPLEKNNAEKSGDSTPADDCGLTGGGDDGNKSKGPSPEEKYIQLNDAHLRLMAEFDNFRKRTLREKADLIKSGGATVLTNLLPVVDDFERALSTLSATENVTSVVEGVKLIYDKFMAYLSQQGVKTIDAIGKPFDTELFEAIAAIPAPEESMKGKVIDCVQTGYTLYDKVLRHAKVVVGE
jgi:molecular chaperone GrpE